MEKITSEELHNFYSNVISMIKSREILVGHIACMGKLRNTYCSSPCSSEAFVNFEAPKKVGNS
jgi:hypothetical protein